MKISSFRCAAKFIVPLMLLLGAASASASSVEVRLKLPVRARLDLGRHESVATLPFLVVSREGEGQLADRSVDVQEEFDRYLVKILRRDTDLRIVESGPVDFPTYDIDALASDSDFWRAVAERTGADLVLCGSLDFDIQDRSGYRTEEYSSPFDGRTYYRQVLVENTGFEFDIVLQVFDGDSGKLLFSDNFKDFRQLDQGDADPIEGMFANLYALEDRISGIFAQRRIEARRTIYTD